MKKTSYKPPRSSSDTAMNAVIAVVILAVLGAGIYAVYPKISERIQNNSSNTTAALNTAGDAAKDKGMSFKKFLETYGLTDEITKDTDLSDTISAMTLEKVALYNDTDIDTFRANNFIPEDVTNDTKWEDVMPVMPLKAIIGSEDTANQIISIYGLDGVLTPETPWGEAEEILNAAQEALMQAQENAAAAQENSDENPEENSDEPSENPETSDTSSEPASSEN